MYIADGVDHGTRAGMLVRQLIDGHDPKYGVGSFSCSIYDTAWVAMVTKTTDEHSKWLFPWSFHYLLGHQQHDGGWHTSNADVDGILNTLAALLALCKHITNPHQLIYIPQEELTHKKDRAIYYLEAKFFMWDVAATQQKGFEILVPKLLQLLEQDGIEFSFPGRARLMELKTKAAAKLNPSMIYSNSRTILTQALEGFVGELDFDRVSQHKISGSMMASPASTAAYLMNCSTWDDEAEGYLSHVVSLGDEKSTGGVPSRYPTTVFEVTTALSLLLENGFTPEELGERHLKSATEFLDDCLGIESGVTGFAPYVESDADNTARAISTLCHLGKPTSPSGLIIRYETREFFKTYTQDRTPSFRTNCLVLKALLDLVPGNREQVSQIEKTVKFITNCWWTTNGQVEDTWNASGNYATMLMADALVRLVDLWEQGLVPVLDDLILKDKVFVCLFQALTRTMQTQNRDGSWGTSSQRCESTSYAVLTLAKLATFSSAPRIKLQLGTSLESGRSFLAKNFRPTSEPDHVWNSKTTCGSSILFQAYIMASLQSPARIPQPGHSLENRFEVPVAKIAIQTKYYSRQPWFANIPEWQIQAFLVESYLFLPQLRDVRFAVFPKDTLADDRYFDSIPFAWIAASTADQRYVGAEFLYQLMILTFLNRQFEAYVQNVLAKNFANNLVEIEDVVQNIFEEVEKHTAKDQCFCDGQDNDPTGCAAATSASATLPEVRSVLYRYISHILNHPYVLMASHHDQEQLHAELLFFLLGRIGQQLSNAKNASSAIADEAMTQTTGNSSTDQTFHQFTFAFLTCIVGNQTTPSGSTSTRRNFLDTPEQQYLVADICRRLSILSFVTTRAAEDNAPQAPYREPEAKARPTSFSDYDRRSIHSTASISSQSSSYSDGSSPVSPASSVSSAPSRSPAREMFLKQSTVQSSRSTSHPEQHTLQLNRLLTHERKCLKICLESLTEAGTEKRTTNILRVFVDVSELSEQIFHDPNVGSYQANIAHQIIERASVVEQPCTSSSEAPPVPPKRADRRVKTSIAEKRGSVSAARAALEIAPLQPKRDSVVPALPTVHQPSELPAPVPASATHSRTASSIGRSRAQSASSHTRTLSFSVNGEVLSVPGKDDCNAIDDTATEGGLGRPLRASRSSVEMSRVERIMKDIDGGNPRNSTLPVHPALRRKTSEQFPKPKINPMLPVHPELSRGKTQVDRTRSHTISGTRPRIPEGPTPVLSPISSVPLEDITNSRSIPQRKPTVRLDLQAHATSGGLTREDAEAMKAAHKRMATLSRTESKMKARARDAAIDRERKRASCLQARAMAEAACASAAASTRSSSRSSPTKKGEKLRKQMTASTSTLSVIRPSAPMSVDVAKANGLVPRTSTLELAPPGSAVSGWIKSPPPMTMEGAVASPVEIARQGTLKRDSKWGGPKWKAPF